MWETKLVDIETYCEPILGKQRYCEHYAISHCTIDLHVAQHYNIHFYSQQENESRIFGSFHCALNLKRLIHTFKCSCLQVIHTVND